jgi:hypothetical protein
LNLDRRKETAHTSYLVWPHSEVYYLIWRLLASAGPLQRSAQVLFEDLARANLLPRAYHWSGTPLPPNPLTLVSVNSASPTPFCGALTPMLVP